MYKNITIVFLAVVVIGLGVFIISKNRVVKNQQTADTVEIKTTKTYVSVRSLFDNRDSWKEGDIVEVTGDVRASDLCADGENLDYTNKYTCIMPFQIFDENKVYPLTDNDDVLVYLTDKDGVIYKTALRGSKCDATCNPFPEQGTRFTLVGSLSRVEDGSGVEQWNFKVLEISRIN